MNLVILTGRIGRDAETKFTPSGAAVSTLSIATTKRWRTQDGEQKEKTEWHNLKMWRKEKLAEYLTKGKLISITGELETSSWEDKDSGKKVYRTEVVVNELEFLSNGKSDAEEGGESRGNGRSQARGNGGGYIPPHKRQPTQDDGMPHGAGGDWDPDQTITDDDIPF